MTRAARQLRTSQSALSAHVRDLEDDVGHPLFLREGRTLELTEVGRVVLGYAESIFSMGQEMMAAIRAGEGQRAQQLRIGAVATLSRNFLENFIRPVLSMEDVHVVIESGSLDELLSRLTVHKLHLVLSNRAVPADSERSWRCRRIAKQPVCLVGPPRPSSRPFRFPWDLSELRLLVPGYSSDVRTSFDVLCEELKLTPRVLAHVDDMAMLRVMARERHGVALVPEVVVQDELKSGRLEVYCVVPKVHENFYAVTTERRFLPQAMKKLFERRG